MASSWRGAAMAWLLVGCAAPEPTGEAGGAIIDGTVADADDAVVGLVAHGQLYCTGALVAPHVVLTAAHCLTPSPPEFDIEPGDVKVFVGTSWAEGGWIIDNTDIWVHPEHLTGSSWKDIGLIALTDAPAQSLLPRTTAPIEGESARILGFGRIDPNAEGDDVKRSGTATVSSVLPQGMLLQADPAAACLGDSGGPALIEEDGVEKIAGVHARSFCDFESTEMRVDLFVDDIQAFVDSHPSPTCDAGDGCFFACGTPDPDCPEPEPEDEAETDAGGCAVGTHRPGGPNTPAWLVVMLGAMLARARARARGRGRTPRAGSRRPVVGANFGTNYSGSSTVDGWGHHS